MGEDAHNVFTEMADDPDLKSEEEFDSYPLHLQKVDDPTKMSPEMLDRMLDRVKDQCFQVGQRVRIRRPNAGSLSGEKGTVVIAGPNHAYVAVDIFVAHDDPDPFRFQEYELEAIYEGEQPPDPDDVDPQAYMASVDYLTPLRRNPKLGYHYINGSFRRYIRTLALRSDAYPVGDLRVEVKPCDNLHAVIRLAIDTLGGRTYIQTLQLPAIDVLDTLREIHEMAEGASTFDDFIKQLEAKHYPGSIVYNPFDKSVREAEEPEDVDSPELYFRTMERQYKVIDAFIANNARIRRVPSVKRPWFELEWIPAGCLLRTYYIKPQPEPDGSWTITADLQKYFYDERHGDYTDWFDVEGTWTIPPEPEDLDDLVWNILNEISSFEGPEDGTDTSKRVMDEDQEDDPDSMDYLKYALASQNYNPIVLLSSKDLRKIAKTIGYRVDRAYKSARTGGWALTLTPVSDEAFKEFKLDSSYAKHLLEETYRQGIEERLAIIYAKYGERFFEDVMRVSAWTFSGLSARDPEDRHNYTGYVDILPVRKPRVAEAAEDPDEFKDVEGYVKNVLGEEIYEMLERLGFIRQDTNISWEGKHDYQKTYPLNGRIVQPGLLPRVFNKVRLAVDCWGQMIYALETVDGYFSRTDIVLVNPIQRDNEDDDYKTSIYRLVLGAEAALKVMPEFNEVRPAMNWLWMEINRVAQAVNEQARQDQKSSFQEAVSDPDDPEPIIAHYKPNMFALYAQSEYDEHPVGFSVYDSPEDALAYMRNREMHVEYGNIWLEIWIADSADIMFAKHTGYNYWVGADYELEKISDEELRKRIKVADVQESVDPDDVDPETYAATTHDPVAFLQQYGWTLNANRATGDYYAKDFLLPLRYTLGGMIFDTLRVELGLDPRGDYTPTIVVYFMPMGAKVGGLPVMSGHLHKPIIYNEHGNEVPEGEYDQNISVRRFVSGLDAIVAEMPWNQKPAQAMARDVEMNMRSYVEYINAQADKPVRYQESTDPDDPEHYIRRLQPEPFITTKIPNCPQWTTVRSSEGHVIGWYREPDPTGKYGHPEKWQVTLDAGAAYISKKDVDYEYLDSEQACKDWIRSRWSGKITLK